MKLKDVVIGEMYLTRIGERLARVIVVGTREDTFSGRTRFLVRRVGEDRVLPKSRAPSALREFLTPRNKQVPILVEPTPESEAFESAFEESERAQSLAECPEGENDPAVRAASLLSPAALSEAAKESAMLNLDSES
jgi:hypothetical protein